MLKAHKNNPLGRLMGPKTPELQIKIAEKMPYTTEYANSVHAEKYGTGTEIGWKIAEDSAKNLQSTRRKRQKMHQILYFSPDCSFSALQMQLSWKLVAFSAIIMIYNSCVNDPWGSNAHICVREFCGCKLPMYVQDRNPTRQTQLYYTRLVNPLLTLLMVKR